MKKLIAPIVIVLILLAYLVFIVSLFFRTPDFLNENLISVI